MRIRYTKQNNNYGCGPIAIINLLKWSGHRATIKTHYEFLEKACATKDPDGHEYSGTKAKDFDRVLHQVGKRVSLKVVHRMIPTYRGIVNHLEKGGSVVLLHKSDHGNLHYTLVTKIESNTGTPVFEVVNAFWDTPARHFVGELHMKAWLCRDGHYPQAWFVKRYNKTRRKKNVAQQ